MTNDCCVFYLQLADITLVLFVLQDSMQDAVAVTFLFPHAPPAKKLPVLHRGL